MAYTVESYRPDQNFCTEPNGFMPDGTFFASNRRLFCSCYQ
jgi:hypothetical protein